LAQKLKIIPLGGLGEVGKNSMVVQYGKQMVLIDAGLKFPDQEMPGIDLVLPDFSYVKENLLGIVLTHGHEDHIGALPYLFKDVDATVYGTKLTLGLLEQKLKEHKLKERRLKEIFPGNRIKLGPFDIEFMRVSHSIPDGVALAIHTPIGTVVHSGDFKFDQTPIDGKQVDFSKLSLIGSEGVLALMSDSTNAEVSGFTLPEKSVGHTIDEIFSQTKGRIIVASFASHIHRIQQVIDIAHKHRRKVLVSGRSMLQNIDVAYRLGYLKVPENILIEAKDINKYKNSRMVVMCTGSQGEPLSALTRMAVHDHRHIQIQNGDTVIISATPVPGNENAVSRTINLLFKSGANVLYERISDVHVSGHACVEELKMMINLIKPKFFVPIHGEIRHLMHHARIAENLGFSSDDIFMLENGDVLEFNSKGKCHKNGSVESGMVLVDGLGVGDISSVILRDRQQLSRDGICVVVVGISSQDGRLVTGPDINCRGFVFLPDSADLLENAKQRVIESINKSAAEKITDYEVLKAHIQDILKKYFYKAIGRRPMVIPVVMEV
jgi:ribonuclease J